ncbi:MAG: hypothetical protein ACRD8O_06445 [Bryobacteraceae bacterium]
MGSPHNRRINPWSEKETVLDSWKAIRQATAQTVEDFPAAEFGFKPFEELAAFGEIARHILDAGHALTGMLLDGAGDLRGPQFREMIFEVQIEAGGGRKPGGTGGGAAGRDRRALRRAGRARRGVSTRASSRASTGSA